MSDKNRTTILKATDSLDRNVQVNGMHQLAAFIPAVLVAVSLLCRAHVLSLRSGADQV